MLISICSAGPQRQQAHLASLALSHCLVPSQPIAAYIPWSFSARLQAVQNRATGLNLSVMQKGQLSLLDIQALRQEEWQGWPHKVIMWQAGSRQIAQVCSASMQQGKHYSRLYQSRLTGGRAALPTCSLSGLELRWDQQMQEQMHLKKQKTRGLMINRKMTIVLALQPVLQLLKRSQLTVFPLYFNPQQTCLQFYVMVPLSWQLLSMVSGSLKQIWQLLPQKAVLQHFSAHTSTKNSCRNSISSKRLLLLAFLQQLQDLACVIGFS